MADASALIPSSRWQPPPLFDSSSCPPRTSAPSPSSTPTQSTIILSSEPRCASDESDVSARQSLPSISEVISDVQSAKYPTPAHQQRRSKQLSPAATSSRQYSASDKQPPQPSPFPVRQEGFSDSSNSPLPPSSGRLGFPSASNRRLTPHSPRDPPSPHIVEELPGSRNGYSRPAPPSSHPSQLDQLISWPIPHPGYPISPREHCDAHHNPDHEALEYAGRIQYQPASNRHFQTWSYQESFSRLGSRARTVLNFAETYGRIAQEHQGSQSIPENLPTEREVGEMLAAAEYIRLSLEQIRDVVQTSIQSQRARERAKTITFDEDSHNHDVHMYRDKMKKCSLVTKVKKRRGRAAQPGRCHSCNRSDTPEWRRGPNGARTLCNACGLHYAKLERKRQLETTTPGSTQA